MTKLSICIPVDSATADPTALAFRLLAEAGADLEVVVASRHPLPDTLFSLAKSDRRLTCLPAVSDLSTRRLWHSVLSAATGDWVTLIGPNDALEPQLALMVAYLDRDHPTIDALAWNAFQIDPSVEPAKAASVAIPAKYAIDAFDKTAMLKAFFYWERSLNAPKMPFGVHHAAVRRSLLTAMLQLPVDDSWATPVPKYEWAAKALLFADELAFCARPMSAVDATPYRAPADWKPATLFPFHAGIGMTGAIAEVQMHVLAELGNGWTGNPDFVRACMIDCMLAPTRPDFVASGNAYFAALQQLEGGDLAAQFRPEYPEAPKIDKRRGLHGEALLIDRFIGGAKTPPEFYNVARSMIAPVGLICGGVIR